MIALLLAALIAAPRPPKGAEPQAPAPAQQLSDEELRERVETYLGTIDRPVSQERWKALGPQAAPILEAVIGSSSELPTRRAMAVDGLTAVSPDRAAQMVGNLARDEKQPTVVRVAAMHGAMRVYPSARVISELRPVLRSAKSPGLRAEAADLISRKQGGCAEVREQLGREKAEHKPAFDRAMKRCGG
ncbi:MAG TPA: hypothetical protein VMK66_10425 [Myxococcales bacterium]|nr:hypothetical protein [Myxococcales bacterium]